MLICVVFKLVVVIFLFIIFFFFIKKGFSLCRFVFSLVINNKFYWLIYNVFVVLCYFFNKEVGFKCIVDFVDIMYVCIYFVGI